AHEHDRVLLEVVADAGDVRRDLDLARELHAGHLAQRRVRLLGGRRVDAGAHTAPLRAALQGRRLRGRLLRRPALAHELLDRGHYVSPARRLVEPGSAPGLQALPGLSVFRPVPTPAPGRVGPFERGADRQELLDGWDRAVGGSPPGAFADLTHRGRHPTRSTREGPTARAQGLTLPAAASERQSGPGAPGAARRRRPRGATRQVGAAFPRASPRASRRTSR